MAKKVTIDNLARMVQAGFYEMTDNFNQLKRELSDFKIEMRRSIAEIHRDLNDIKIKLD